MEEILKQLMQKDPVSFYLDGLGKSIANITSDEWLKNGSDGIRAKHAAINDLHAKAIEVIKLSKNKD